MANELTRADRKTRYVIDGQNRFKILSTDEIDAMKIRGFFKKGVTMLDIYKRSVYVATYNKMIKEDWQKVRYAQRKKLDGKY